LSNYLIQYNIFDLNDRFNDRYIRFQLFNFSKIIQINKYISCLNQNILKKLPILIILILYDLNGVKSYNIKSDKIIISINNLVYS